MNEFDLIHLVFVAGVLLETDSSLCWHGAAFTAVRII